jgi:hypothetical protein
MRLTVPNARIVVVYRVLERLTLEQKNQLVDWVWVLTYNKNVMACFLKCHAFCRVSASKLSLSYVHITYTDIIKNKVLLSTF